MSPTVVSPMFAIRDAKNGANAIPVEHVLPMMVRNAHPYRLFRWYLGQPHYSGSYWSSSESAHVVYESRLELSRLLMADFDPSLNKIAAQPFLMRVRSSRPDQTVHSVAQGSAGVRGWCKITSGLLKLASKSRIQLATLADTA